MGLLYPVILSGGSGTRLWPLSRAQHPKQFIHFFDGQKASFLGSTLARLKPGEGFANPIVICNADHRFLVRDEAEHAGVTPDAVILEPMARNTAPAIAAAASFILARDPEAVMIVMPSDHVLQNEPRFVEAVQRAAVAARRGKLTLFGVPPTEPHTGYGYIRKGAELPGCEGACAVDAFFEKPDAATASSYLAAGNYYWNSGIFVLPAAIFLDELRRYAPQALDAAQRAVALAKTDPEFHFLTLDKTAFAEAPDISIDYAVMEKTSAAAMLPLDVGWNDVGSWSALWSLAPQDANGNVVQGDALLEDSVNCLVHSDASLVAAIGVEDLIIAGTPDAILVAHRSRAQDVGKLVSRLKAANRSEPIHHRRVHRPWGFFESLSDGARFQVKLLHVKPGGKLSHQMHYHRSEHWVVIKGTARVAIAGGEKLLHENESVYISAGQWHRLENPGKIPLEIIEVQMGGYLGEDDIVRGDDVYRRTDDD
jgi:mannose-1-phosphate guanylyltransferase / mannose-6-phosphate isomerase